MKKPSIVVAALLLSACASQSSVPREGAIPERDANIGYSTPQEALDALRNKSTARIREERGWIVVTDDPESATTKAVWSFTPEAHPAHPAVIKRTVYEEKGAVWMRTGIICGGSKDECDKLVRQFNELNQRAQESMRNQKK